ncbi:hypothetical protein ANN_04543 [Periplaneta americana]|uniref:Uncharacterized protein n=1 Tax=Periplaneta americana TaxID=6978 RepID=A0ABQ8T8U8_PERAM|nr:hypothetical protein ANN_04543 [Periplaneta americana]
MDESRNAYIVLVGMPEGKRSLGRPRRRWEDNIKMDLREVGYDDRDWVNLAQDRDRSQAYVRIPRGLQKNPSAAAITSFIDNFFPANPVKSTVQRAVFEKDRECSAPKFIIKTFPNVDCRRTEGAGLGGMTEVVCSKPGYAANLSVVSRCGLGMRPIRGLAL